MLWGFPRSLNASLLSKMSDHVISHVSHYEAETFEVSGLQEQTRAGSGQHTADVNAGFARYLFYLNVEQDPFFFLPQHFL